MVAIGAAAVSLAAVVGMMAPSARRGTVAVSGNAAFAAGEASMLTMPVRRTALAAGLAAVGADLLCS